MCPTPVVEAVGFGPLSAVAGLNHQGAHLPHPSCDGRGARFSPIHSVEAEAGQTLRELMRLLLFLRDLGTVAGTLDVRAIPGGWKNHPGLVCSLPRLRHCHCCDPRGPEVHQGPTCGGQITNGHLERSNVTGEW